MNSGCDVRLDEAALRSGESSLRSSTSTIQSVLCSSIAGRPQRSHSVIERRHSANSAHSTNRHRNLAPFSKGSG
jgi:hypothetical protein